MKNKIGGLIITYNPDIHVLIENIRVVRAQVGKCLIVDNASLNVDRVDQVACAYDVEIIRLPENKGIATAQNMGFNYFQNKHYEWVLTLDQDSVIPKSTIDKYLKTSQINERSTGIITALYYDRNWTESQKKALIYHGNQSIIQTKYVISSGNLVRVSAWNQVDGFDEFLFIDMVDYDFDAKLALAGYKIWQANEVVINHSVGEIIHRPILEKVLLLPETGLLADHPPFRQYYIYRNTIIFYKRYSNIAHEKFFILRTFLSTRRMLVYKNSISKFRFSWKGIVDGIKYNPHTDKAFLKITERFRANDK